MGRHSRKKSGAREPELEVLRGTPSRPLNLNIRQDMDVRERAALTLSSTPFVFAASLLTLGAYYLYHRYRTNERRQTNDTKTTDQIGEDITLWAKDFREFHSLLNFSDRLNELLNGRPSGPSQPIRKLEAKGRNLLVGSGVILSGFLCSMEKIFVRFTRQSLDFNPLYDIQNQRLAQHVESERRLLDQMSRFLNPTPPTIRSSFDLDSRIVKSLSLERDEKHISYYMKLNLLWIYLLISTLSFGIVPIMNRIHRKNWGFGTIACEEFNVGVNSFNGGLGRLLNFEDFDGFSEFLTRADFWDFSNNVASDLFRTNAFRNPNLRPAMIHLIYLLTLGLFPLYLHLFRFLSRGDLREIREEDIRPFRPKNPSRLGKIWYFLSDVFWDLGVFMNVCMRREFKIIGGFASSGYLRERFMPRVFGLLTNRFCLLFSHITLLALTLIPAILFFSETLGLLFFLPMFYIYLSSHHVSLFFL